MISAWELIKARVARWNVDGSGLRSPSGDLALPTLSTRIRSGLYRPVAMATGNSIARACRPGAPNTSTNKVDPYSYLYWAMSFSGQPFQWARTGAETQIGASASSTMARGIHGYSSANSVDIAALMTSVIGGYAPDVMFIQAMENDPTAINAATITRAQAIAAYESMIRTCLQSGIVPVWIGCLPSLSWSGTSDATEYWALTHAVENLAATYPGMVYVPVWDLYTDTSASYPNPLTSGAYANYTDATVHPKRAAIMIGRRIAQILRDRGLAFDNGRSLPGPGSAKHLGGNTLMSGSGGTAGTGMSGSVPAAMTTSSALASAASTAALSTINGRPVFDLTAVSGSAQTGLVNAVTLAGSNASGYSGFAEGDYAQVFADVELVSAPTNMRGLFVQMSFIGATSNDAYFGVMASADTWDIPSFVGERMLLATPEIPVPSGCTGIRPFLIAYASNNAATVNIPLRVRGLSVVDWSK